MISFTQPWQTIQQACQFLTPVAACAAAASMAPLQSGSLMIELVFSQFTPVEKKIMDATRDPRSVITSAVYKRLPQWEKNILSATSRMCDPLTKSSGPMAPLPTGACHAPGVCSHSRRIKSTDRYNAQHRGLTLR